MQTENTQPLLSVGALGCHSTLFDPQPIAEELLHTLVPLIWQNQRVLFTLLFETSAATLLEVASDPKHLGAEIDLLSILHTWGQTLQCHPHVHCVVPGGGLSLDHAQWVSSRSRFFLPVKVLSHVFRGKFVAGLRRAFGNLCTAND